MLKKISILSIAIFALLFLPPKLSAQSTVNWIIGYKAPVSIGLEDMLSSGKVNLLWEVCIQAKPNFDVSIIFEHIYHADCILIGAGTSLFSSRGKAFDIRSSLVCGLGFPETTGMDIVVGSIIKNHIRILKNWDLVIAPAIEWGAPLVSTIGAQPRFVASLGAGVAYRKGD